MENHLRVDKSGNKKP